MKISRKGFTLAELLIVVAIIAVLVAAIPVFGSQLEKSREAADLANVRAAYAKVLTEANMGIYNEPLEWIKQSIDSILNQTFVDFEFIIVNDNPLRNDNYILLNKYQQIDKRIVVVENESNIGLTESLNKALLLAKG